jgi:hypothetical protein
MGGCNKKKNSREKKSFGGGKFLAADFVKFRPNFAPSMQNRNSLTPPHICT